MQIHTWRRNRKINIVTTPPTGLGTAYSCIKESHMRPIKLLNEPPHTTTQKQILARLQKLELKDCSMDSLLNENSNGNIPLIDELLASAEEMILMEMLRMPESKYSIDDRISHSMATLRKLAIISAADPSRQLFERFSAFRVKRSLIALEAGIRLFTGFRKLQHREHHRLPLHKIKMLAG